MFILRNSKDVDHIKSKGIPKESASLTMLKPLTVWITKSMEYS